MGPIPSQIVHTSVRGGSYCPNGKIETTTIVETQPPVSLPQCESFDSCTHISKPFGLDITTPLAHCDDDAPQYDANTVTNPDILTPKLHYTGYIPAYMQSGSIRGIYINPYR